MNDPGLAVHLAEVAGRILVEDLKRGIFSPRCLGRAGDNPAPQFVHPARRHPRPSDAILSEEMKCDGKRLDCSRVWIIDPLDGTREYGEGRDDWAVHVALVVDGCPVTGAVALPAIGLVFGSHIPFPLVPCNSPPRMLVSRTRPAAEAVAVAAAMGAQLVGMGSAGAKAMAVLRGEAEIYLHTGGQYEWDSCAPSAVAQAAGLHVSRIDGSPLIYNQADAYLPDLLICRPEHAAEVISRAAGAVAR